MEPFKIQRLVHDGSDPSDTWIVTGIGHSKINMENVHKVQVDSIAEYESGCQIHPGENCAGHICVTPSGKILPMQSLAVTTGTVVNDVARAAKMAFEGNSRYHDTKYKQILADSMKRKTGRMRKGILNCHVDGSLRMVITPQEGPDVFWIAIPLHVKDKWTVPYFDESEYKYRIRHVEHGDYAIVVRPPVLSVRSLQPLRIKFWDKPCMGISPYILKAFLGDYDGDEMHVYPVYKPDSIRECENWICSRESKFDAALREFEEMDPKSREDNMFDYMEYTTMSFAEIASGKPPPPMAEYARTRKEHIEGFRGRYDTATVLDSLVADTIRGMADTNAQQISQPVVGDMSRLAKLTAGCVLQKPDGTIGMATRTSFDAVSHCEVDLQSGNACMRGLSYFCAGIQQSALESHHARAQMMPGHDIVSDILVGDKYTVVMLDKRLSRNMIEKATRCKQISVMGNCIMVVCEPEGLTSLPKAYIQGSYSPIVLSMVEEKRRLGLCRAMIEAIARYHEIALSKTEIECISVLYSYKTALSPLPITTRDGNAARSLRWTETAMATHYSKLIELVEEGPIGNVPVDTISARMMSGNMYGT